MTDCTRGGVTEDNELILEGYSCCLLGGFHAPGNLLSEATD